jgi:hypothetical protein
MDHIKGKKPNNFQAMSQQQDINGHQYNELCASALVIFLRRLQRQPTATLKTAPMIRRLLLQVVQLFLLSSFPVVFLLSIRPVA